MATVCPPPPEVLSWYAAARSAGFSPDGDGSASATRAAWTLVRRNAMHPTSPELPGGHACTKSTAAADGTVGATPAMAGAPPSAATAAAAAPATYQRLAPFIGPTAQARSRERRLGGLHQLNNCIDRSHRWPRLPPTTDGRPTRPHLRGVPIRSTAFHRNAA